METDLTNNREKISQNNANVFATDDTFFAVVIRFSGTALFNRDEVVNSNRVYTAVLCIRL